VGFRARLIEANLDRRLVERTIEVATATKGFGHRALRAALDSSPLWGAGRVEDTYNLLGHALRKALGVIARQQGPGGGGANPWRCGPSGLVGVRTPHPLVAKDRRISVEDPDMRHGRKSKSALVNGYKRHICRDLDSGLVRAVGITPANAPEANVTEAISADLDAPARPAGRVAPRPWRIWPPPCKNLFDLRRCAVVHNLHIIARHDILDQHAA